MTRTKLKNEKHANLIPVAAIFAKSMMTSRILLVYFSGIAIYRKEGSFREGRFLYGRKLLNKFICKIIL